MASLLRTPWRARAVLPAAANLWRNGWGSARYVGDFQFVYPRGMLGGIYEVSAIGYILVQYSSLISEGSARKARSFVVRIFKVVAYICWAIYEVSATHAERNLFYLLR